MAYSAPFKLTNDHLIAVRDHPHLLGHLAGRTKLTELHSSWIRHMWDSYEHRALMAHRGSYKTTAMAIGCVRWMLFNPDDRIAVVRKTFTDAAEIVTMVAQIMEKIEVKELFRYAHGRTPRAVVKRFGKLKYSFKRTVTPEGNLTAHGLDGSLVGTHYDRIWTDDIITIKDRISRSERERTIEMIREIYTNIIDPGKPVMASGTPWHKLDGWNNIPCEIVKFPLSKCNILSEEEIAKKRKSTTPFLFAVNYELEFQSEDDKLFKNPVYCDWNVLDGSMYAHLDAAFDGDHYNALTIMSRRGDGKIQAKGWAYPGNVKDWAKEVARICKGNRVNLLHIEENADKGYTAGLLRSFGVNVKDYWENRNKGNKISTNLYNAWDEIEWARDSDPEYMNQVLDWKEGSEPDDAPDSAASLLAEQFPVDQYQDNEGWKL
jgi:hypothetical protein